MDFHNFPFSWECHSIPTDELHHFSEGWRKTTNQLQNGVFFDVGYSDILISGKFHLY